MADRYQSRPFPAGDDYDRSGDQHASARGESNPLAGSARLVGQADPVSRGRANQTLQPRTSARDQYQPPAAAADDGPPAGPPPWMQRAARQESPQQKHSPKDSPSAVHPRQRYAAQHAAPEPDYQQAPPFADADQEPDPSRYDDALYGQIDTGAQESQHDAAYADDAYAYQDSYGDGADDHLRKRRRRMLPVAVFLAVAVVGPGDGFAYRTYVGAPRSGEPPIIKADAGPTKTATAPGARASKRHDHL